MNKTAMQKRPSLQERAFRLISERPGVTRQQIAMELGITEQRAREVVSHIKKKGWVNEIKILVPINKTLNVDVK